MPISFLERIKLLYKVNVLQGYTGEEIAQLKDMFGALPQVLEDYYRVAGRTDAFHHVQDRWILPENFQRWEWLGKMKITLYGNAPDNMVAVMDCDGDIQMLYGAASEASYAKLRTVLEDIGEPM